MKTNANANFVLSGRGGQGILFATAVLERACLDEGWDLIGSETHGMAQRGGSVVSHLKIGKSLGPLVAAGEADVLLSLERNETLRCLPFLRRGGACFTNQPDGVAFAPKVAAMLEEKGSALFALDADGLARELRAPRAANAALLGLFAAWPDNPFPEGSLRKAVSLTGNERFRAKNLEVFEAAFARARERCFSAP